MSKTLSKKELIEIIENAVGESVFTITALNIDSEPLSLFIADDGFLISESEETVTLQLQWKRTVKG